MLNRTTITLLFLLLSLFLFQRSFSQDAGGRLLTVILDKYEGADTLPNDADRDKTRDSIWMVFINSFEEVIQNKNTLRLEMLKKKCDATNFRLGISHSENREFTLYTFSNGFNHLNYITQKAGAGRARIILRDNKTHAYFTAIHNIAEHEFLLIERMDELVFSCYYAYVYGKRNGQFTKKPAFLNKYRLSVCTFTEIEEPAVIQKAGDTGMIRQSAGHFSRAPGKLYFDYKTKTLSYFRARPADGKEVRSKASYKNGRFDLEDADERKSE